MRRLLTFPTPVSIENTFDFLFDCDSFGRRKYLDACVGASLSKIFTLTRKDFVLSSDFHALDLFRKRVFTGHC